MAFWRIPIIMHGAYNATSKLDTRPISASEVTTLRRYTNLFIIIMFIIEY